MKIKKVIELVNFYEKVKILMDRSCAGENINFHGELQCIFAHTDYNMRDLKLSNISHEANEAMNELEKALDKLGNDWPESIGR